MDGEDKKVTIKDDYNYIELFVGSKECYINAVKQAMDTSPEYQTDAQWCH